MEFLIELLFDLVFEGSFEISKNKKITKWIRYPLILLIVLLFTFVILLIFFVGLNLLKDYILVGSLFIGLGIFMIIYGINKFKKIYIEKNLEEK